MARIGLLGGTFDPPHRGHVTVAAEVSRALDLDEIWLVPVATPPHKPHRPITDAQLRLDMVRALVDLPLRQINVSDVEIARGGVSYTVDTLRGLTAAHPDHEFYLVMGVDQFVTLSTWKDPEEVGRLSTVVVMSREGVEPVAVAPGTEVPGVPVRVTRVDISSTDIRRRVAQGEDVSALVGEPVARLITEYGLYRSDQG